MRTVVLLSAIVLLLSGQSIAPEGPGTVDTSRAFAELEVARAQNEMLREHNDELLSSVEWAVGAIVTLVAGALVLLVIVSGVNIFQYNRRYAEDKSRMLAELDATIAERLTETLERLTAQGEQNRREVITALDARLDVKTRSIRSEIDASAKQIRREVDDMKLDAKMDDVEERLKSDHIGEYALILAGQALSLTHTAEHGWLRQSDILLAIRKIVLKLKTKSVEIEPDTVSSLFTELNQLDKFPEEVEDIKNLIRDYRNQ